MSDIISNKEFLKFRQILKSLDPSYLQDKVKKYLPLGCIVNGLKTGQGVKRGLRFIPGSSNTLL